jgi:hypothetical protein
MKRRPETAAVSFVQVYGPRPVIPSALNLEIERVWIPGCIPKMQQIDGAGLFVDSIDQPVLDSSANAEQIRS